MGELVFTGCGVATEILSSLFWGLKLFLNMPSLILPWHCALLAVHAGHPRDHHSHPSPQFLSLGTMCPQTLCHMGSSHCSFSPKGHWIPGLSPQGAGGGEESQGLLAQDNLPHLLAQGHSEVQVLLPALGSHVTWVCLFPVGASVSSSIKWACCSEAQWPLQLNWQEVSA